MTETIDVRKVRIDDLDALQTISRDTFSETFAAMNKAEDMEKYLSVNLSKKQLLRELENPASDFYFAMHEERVIGYIKINHGDAQMEPQDTPAIEIEKLYVMREYHGKYIGALLLDTARLVAKLYKVESIWLGVWEKNERAILFYQKHGFQQYGQHLFMLGNDAQTDLLMRLQLH